MFSRTLAASIAIAGAVTALAACGSNSSSDSATTAGSSQASSKGATAIKPGKAGGKLTVLASADVDYLDPGQTYYTFGYMVHYAVNRTLYSFKPDNPEKPVEDLAAGPPEISRTTRRYRPHQAGGQVRAAGRPRGQGRRHEVRLRARVLHRRSPVGYAGTYFSSIVGTPARPDSGDIKPISGIEAPDDTTIVFSSKTASAPLVGAGAGDADHDACAPGVRGEVRPEDAVDLRPVHRLHRALHGQARSQTAR